MTSLLDGVQTRMILPTGRELLKTLQSAHRTLPPADVPVLKCQVEIAPGAVVLAYAIGDNILVPTGELDRFYPWMPGGVRVEEVPPFIQVESVGDSFTQDVTTTVRKPRSQPRSWLGYGPSYDTVEERLPARYAIN